MDKRIQGISNFFRRMDRIALFGPDGQMLKEQKKEQQVERRIIALRQKLDTCPICGSTADFKWEKNFEYPEGVRVQCNKCGLRTQEFVRFTEPNSRGRQSYSKIKSVQTAVEHWNNRL